MWLFDDERRQIDVDQTELGAPRYPHPRPNSGRGGLRDADRPAIRAGAAWERCLGQGANIDERAAGQPDVSRDARQRETQLLRLGPDEPPAKRVARVGVVRTDTTGLKAAQL